MATLLLCLTRLLLLHVGTRLLLPLLNGLLRLMILLLLQWWHSLLHWHLLLGLVGSLHLRLGGRRLLHAVGLLHGRLSVGPLLLILLLVLLLLLPSLRVTGIAFELLRACSEGAPRRWLLRLSIAVVRNRWRRLLPMLMLKLLLLLLLLLL